MAVSFVQRRRRQIMALGALACLLAAIFVQGRIEGLKPGAAAHPLLYLPSGKYLKVMALGFDGLLADVLYLWSIQYYGNYDIKDRFDYLERIYEQVITELDPHYLDPYLVGALIMTAEARKPEMALKLLDKGVRANPDQWIMPFEAGFLCYNDLHDYRRAAVYFEMAMRVPGVHPLVHRFQAEMYDRAGDKSTSLKEWLEIYKTTTDPYVGGLPGVRPPDRLARQYPLAVLRPAARPLPPLPGADLATLSSRGGRDGAPLRPPVRQARPFAGIRPAGAPVGRTHRAHPHRRAPSAPSQRHHAAGHRPGPRDEPAAGGRGGASG